jgi:hypothetical protein
MSLELAVMSLGKPSTVTQCGIPMSNVGLHLLVVEQSTDKTLEAEDGILGVDDTLSLGG